jgi:hypothetical protein
MRQARFGDAATVLKQAAASLPVRDADRVQVLRLQQLCRRWLVLDARLPAVLGGKEKPANAGEQLDFAQLCFWKKHYVAAARFYRDVFAAAPGLAEKAPTDIRYLAACAAARAGCGQGMDADKLDDRERARWRRQGLEWLRQDLARWGKALGQDNPQTGAQVRQFMRRWQTDVNLASVRTKDALAKLPEEERKQWQGLWSGVDALLRRVSAPE